MKCSPMNSLSFCEASTSSWISSRMATLEKAASRAAPNFDADLFAGEGDRAGGLADVDRFLLGAKGDFALGLGELVGGERGLLLGRGERVG